MKAQPDRPEVSVVIPAYNQARWLPRCVKSVQAQTIEAIEIIIVDDCSSDDTSDVAARLAKDDARIVCLRTPENAGPSAARHLGMETAQSAFVATLDADDVYLSPRKLEAERDLCLKHAKGWQAGDRLFPPRPAGP